MKRLRYKNYSKIVNSEAKERFKQLSKVAKRNQKINRFIGWFLFCSFLFWLIALLVVAITAKSWITNESLAQFVKIVSYVLLLPLPIVMTVLNYRLLKRFFRPVEPTKFTTELICKIAEPLRIYYKVPEKDYIVTKCTCSTLESMIDKDVLLFIADGKLRITNDFFHSKFDFGCFEFEKEEVTVKYINDDGRIKTLIKSKDFILYLGKRAKPFIYKQWLKKPDLHE